MNVAVECDFPKGANENDLDSDWHIKLGPMLGRICKEIGLPAGAVLFVEIKNYDDPAPMEEEVTACSLA